MALTRPIPRRGKMNNKMNNRQRRLLVLAAVLCFAGPAGAASPLDARRIQEVAAMLPEQPAGVGRPINDRAAWEALAKQEAYRDVLIRAAKLLTQPLPEQTDELFLDFSRTGNRTRFQEVAFERRRNWVTTLVLAECLENGGRFLPKIEEVIGAICAERTWVLPAHDRKLENFGGQIVDVDLFSSEVAWNFATADWLLGEKLSAATRQRLRDNVRQRVIEPFRAAIRGESRLCSWLRSLNNWNAVCLAGCVGAALAQPGSRAERAECIVGAEHYSKNFLAGFTPDGYCSEGLGYWNYGFGRYVLLAETIRQATGGGLDLFVRPEVKAPATFATRIQIIGGVAPAFADCAVDARPSGAVLWFVNRRLGLGLRDYERLDARDTLGSLFEACLYGFPNSASAMKPRAEERGYEPGLRSWFQDAGILIGRPAPGSACRMGVALKGGHNAEHHNHNDVGSFVVVVGRRAVLMDPGAETYTARTFSSQRYESRLLNSFGHPVPVVAGRFQRSGRTAQAKVLRTEFTDQADTLALDIASAYGFGELKRLERTFVYSREGDGSLTVTDRVEFASPQTFGTALITEGTWQRADAGSVLVQDGGEAVRVGIRVLGGEFEVKAEKIEEDAKVKPTRIGINLAKPVTEATVTMTIQPVATSRP